MKKSDNIYDLEKFHAIKKKKHSVSKKFWRRKIVKQCQCFQLKNFKFCKKADISKKLFLHLKQKDILDIHFTDIHIRQKSRRRFITVKDGFLQSKASFEKSLWVNLDILTP